MTPAVLPLQRGGCFFWLSLMSSTSLFFWLACAVALFWAVGAYNRLVRLRAGVRKAFAVLDEQLLRQVVWVQACLPESMRGAVSVSGIAQDQAQAAWTRLSAASEQFAVSLAQVRAQPIDGTATASLAMAHDAMVTAWEGALRDAVGSEEGEASAERLHARWVTLLHQALPLQDAYNAAVQTYNHAIAQFPAMLLAWVFGIRPAGLIGRLASAHVNDALD